MAKEISRRSFLKTTLATAGTIGISSMSIPFAAAEDTPSRSKPVTMLLCRQPLRPMAKTPRTAPG